MQLNHVLTKAAWEVACRAGAHAPAELARDGFLHCCLPEQLGFVLARHFAGAKDLLVLTFESDALAGSLQWVKSEPDPPPFPHLYAAIPCSAVLSAVSVA
jgi:uncharacterized protein (DUF952 family)